MIRLAILLATIWIAAILSGCGSSVKVKTPIQATPSLSAGTWTGTVDGATISLSLSKDGKFQTVFRGGNFRTVVRGTASIVDSKVVLDASDFDGRPPQTKAEEMPISFEYSSDWQTLKSDNGAVLHRSI